MKRRSFLTSLAASTGLVGLSAAGLWASQGFRSPANALAEIAISLKTKNINLGFGAETSHIWGYEVDAPDQGSWPVLRAKMGDMLKVKIRNELADDTSIHWHGLRLPNDIDGVSKTGIIGKKSSYDTIELESDYFIEFPLRDPGTYWMHSHFRSWDQVGRGLYAMVIVENPNEPKVYDVPLVFDDWPLTRSGSFDIERLGHLHDWSHGGTVSEHMTVNGLAKPQIPVPRKGWVRFRALNASTDAYKVLDFKVSSRAYTIALDGYSIDPQRLDAPVILGPGQRADILAYLNERNNPEPSIKQDGHALVSFIPREGLKTDLNPSALKSFKTYLPKEIVPTGWVSSRSELVLEGGAMGRMSSAELNGSVADWRALVDAGKVWALNGRADWKDEPIFSLSKGQTHELSIKNDTSWPHAVHLHGQHFKIVENAGLPSEIGRLRDTVNVAPSDTVKIQLKGAEPGLWMVHCHMLGHQASGMVGKYQIT